MSWFAAFLFFLPAGIANTTPVFVNKIPTLNRWKTPLDFGKSWKGVRIFGENKTWRGLVCGMLVAAITGWIIGQTASSVIMSPLIGAALGAGALIGDALESFLKRRHGIDSGKKWFPFDQTDYIIGGLLFVLPLTSLTLQLVLRIFILYFGLHLLVAFLAFKVGLKDSPI